MCTRILIAALLATSTFYVPSQVSIAAVSKGAIANEEASFQILATTGTPGITLTKLNIEQGFLIIQGQTTSPFTVVKLVGTIWKATSGDENLHLSWTTEPKTAEFHLVRPLELCPR